MAVRDCDADSRNPDGRSTRKGLSEGEFMTTTEHLDRIDNALYGDPTDKERNEAMESLTALRATLAAMEQQQSQTTALLLAEMHTAIELRTERAALTTELEGKRVALDQAWQKIGEIRTEHTGVQRADWEQIKVLTK